MTTRVLTAVLVGVLAASPALAQERRGLARDGGARGGDRAQARTPDRGEGRQAVPRGPQPRGYDAPQREAPRAYAPAPRAEAPRAEEYRREAPRVQGYRPEAPRVDASRAPRAEDYRPGYTGRYAVPRSDARGYVQPAPPRVVERSYDRPSLRYDDRRRDDWRDDGRRYDVRRYDYDGRRYVRPGYRAYPYRYGYGRTVVVPRIIRPRVITVLPHYQPYYYRPSLSIGVYYGAGGVYPYGYTPRHYYDPLPGVAYGGLRITDAPRDAQVFADGYYVGLVDDFDGAFQHLNLEAGEHRIEIHAPGFEPIAFDVLIQPGRTVTLRADVW